MDKRKHPREEKVNEKKRRGEKEKERKNKKGNELSGNINCACQRILIYYFE
jgi:hypothetical protein